MTHPSMQHLDPELREEILIKNQRAEFWRRLAIVMALFFNAAVLGTLIALVILIRATQTEGSPTTKRLIGITRQIESCTTEGGACAARQAKSTGKALAVIDARTIDTVALALACQERLHTDAPDEIKRCIKAGRR